MALGIVFALIAIIAWGVGDFLLQKGTRVFGAWETIFIIALFGAIGVFPFVYTDIPLLSSRDIGILFGISFVLLVAAVLQLNSLRIGKVSVIEPIFALEIPVAALLAGYLLNEAPSLLQGILILSVFLGVVLVSIEDMKNMRRVTTEPGALLGVIATILMGSVNFLFGFAAREISPLMVNWFTDVFLVLAAGVYLLMYCNLSSLWKRVKENRALVVSMGILDNTAWVAYTASMVLIPIAVATGMTESYIVIAVLLGVFLNKERLQKHQIIGLSCTIIGAILLAGSLEI